VWKIQFIIWIFSEILISTVIKTIIYSELKQFFYKLWEHFSVKTFFCEWNQSFFNLLKFFYKNRFQDTWKLFSPLDQLLMKILLLLLIEFLFPVDQNFSIWTHFIKNKIFLMSSQYFCSLMISILAIFYNTCIFEVSIKMKAFLSSLKWRFRKKFQKMNWFFSILQIFYQKRSLNFSKKSLLPKLFKIKF
jgi:hypothetical protein